MVIAETGKLLAYDDEAFQVNRSHFVNAGAYFGEKGKNVRSGQQMFAVGFGEAETITNQHERFIVVFVVNQLILQEMVQNSAIVVLGGSLK